MTDVAIESEFTSVAMPSLEDEWTRFTMIVFSFVDLTYKALIETHERIDAALRCGFRSSTNVIVLHETQASEAGLGTLREQAEQLRVHIEGVLQRVNLLSNRFGESELDMCGDDADVDIVRNLREDIRTAYLGIQGRIVALETGFSLAHETLPGAETT